MVKYLITFPPHLREEIEKSLIESSYNARELEKSKRMKILKISLKKIFDVPLEIGNFSDYKFISDSQVIWNYSIIGEEIMNKKILCQIVKKRLRKEFKSNEIEVELYKEDINSNSC